ncbi:MAG: hypothetical protein ACREQR_20085 [Candidatus Binataceae bacterium]
MATTEADKQALVGLGTRSSLGGSVGGIVLIILGILALARIDPLLLTPIAVIVGGIALLIEDGNLAARYVNALSHLPGENLDVSALADGMSAGVLAGVGGIVLGILALIGIAPEPLASVAIIIFGAAVLFDFAARTQIKALKVINSGSSERSARLAIAAASSTSTAGALVGVGLVTLGILALAGLVPWILVAVALLSFGVYLFLDSTAVATAVFGTMG